MTQPGSLQNHLPPSPDWLVRRLQALERRVENLAGARTLTNASIDRGSLTIKGGQLIVKDANGNTIDVVDADGITVTGGSIAITGGDLTVSGGGQARSGNYEAGVAGWRLGPDGNAEFNDLTLRGGIIGDDALANPISVATSFADINSTDFTEPGGDFAIGTIAVPSGFSRALVMCSGTVGDTRTGGAATGWIQTQAWFGIVGDPTHDSGSQVISGTAADGSALSLTAVWSGLITGIPAGSTLRFGAWVSVQTGGWVAGAGNAHTTALAVFLR